MRCVGVILAGGAGRRLGGVCKPAIRIAGVPALERVRAALAEACDTVVIAAGPHPVARLGALDPSIVCLPDPPDLPPGPVAGIVGAARWLATAGAETVLVSAAADTPFFPSDFAARALPLLDSATGVVVASVGERAYPTNAVWRLGAVLAQPVAGWRGDKGPSLHAFQARMTARIIEYGAEDEADPFANFNTVDQLLDMQRRAMRKAGAS